MLRSLWNSASGMDAQKTKVDTIGNNIANINTDGFKKKDVNFQDLVYQSMQRPAQPVANDDDAVGAGTRVSAITTNFRQGILRGTEHEMDFAIEGDGFFRVMLPEGVDGEERLAYTRNGSFTKDAEGELVTSQGYRVDLPFTLPAGTKSITVNTEGFVEATNQDGEAEEVGQMELARFQNPEGLTSIGANLWQETDNSGEVIMGFPGDEGFGLLRQGFLEGSNVQLFEEMTDLIVAQRGYEINSRFIQSSEEMWMLANQLRR